MSFSKGEFVRRQFLRKAGIWAIAFFLLSAGALGAADDLPYYRASDLRPRSLQVGERFLYHISYLGLVVGEAEAQVKELVEIRGRKAYHIEVHVRSRSVIDYLYRVRDEHHSYVDAEHFHSLQYEKKLSEGRYHVHEKMIYDQEKHEAEYQSITNGSKKIMLIPKNVQDQVSAGFWFRMQKIVPKSKVVVPVNADEKNWDLEVEVGEIKKIKVSGLGQFDAVQLKPKLKFQGLFVRRGKIEGWLGLDSGRIPLMMKVKIPVLGAIAVKLEEYSPGMVRE
jgi:hypothetical protein